MSNIERRNVRIEDWEGNIYYPETQSGSSLAGRIVDAEDATTDLTTNSATITEGSLVADTAANNGMATMIASPTADKILFQTAVSDIPFGKVAVSIRIKSNKNTSDLNLIKVEVYYYDTIEESEGTLLDTKTITGADISTVNKFVDYSFITDFSGTYTRTTCFKIKIIALANNTSTLHFDQVAIAKAMPTI